MSQLKVQLRQSIAAAKRQMEKTYLLSLSAAASGLVAERAVSIWVWVLPRSDPSRGEFDPRGSASLTGFSECEFHPMKCEKGQKC